jgi:hypothetical protein
MKLFSEVFLYLRNIVLIKYLFDSLCIYINELVNQVKVFFIHISIIGLWQNFIFILSFFKFFDLVISFIF